MNADFYLYRTDAMRQIILLLSRGNHRYVSGRESLKNAPLLVAKHTAYGAFYSDQKRWRNRKKGIAGVHVIYLLDEENERFFWWLLVGEGDGLVVDNEKLSDANKRKDRISFAGYECVKVPKKKPKVEPEKRRKSTSQTRWTWQISKEKYEEIEAEIITAIRKKDFSAMRQWDYSLRRMPSFSGVRKQAYKLAGRAKGEWQRSARGPYPLPDFAIGWQGRYKKAKMKTINF